MSLVAKSELLQEIKKYKHILVVKEDFTYDLTHGEKLSDLGILGFTFAGEKGIKWLRLDDNKYVVEEIKEPIGEEFAHLSLSKRAGVRLKEVLR